MSKLKNERQKKSISQTQLADFSKVALYKIVQAELGRCVFSELEIKKIAIVLGYEFKTPEFLSQLEYVGEDL